MVPPERPAGQGVTPFHRDRSSICQITEAQAAADAPATAPEAGPEMADADPARPRLIVGISGASGAIYGARLLELLRPLPVETHLVMTRSAELTLALETELKAGRSARPRRCRACDRRPRRADLVRLVPHDRHDRRAVLDPQHGRDRDRRDDDAADPRRRRDAQGAPPPRADGARNPAAYSGICARWWRCRKWARSSRRRCRPSTPSRRASPR